MEIHLLDVKLVFQNENVNFQGCVCFTDADRNANGDGKCKNTITKAIVGHGATILGQVKDGAGQLKLIRT